MRIDSPLAFFIAFVVLAVFVWGVIFRKYLRDTYVASRYLYHRDSALHYQGRFYSGWGDKSDADKYDYHLARAQYYREKLNP